MYTDHEEQLIESEIKRKKEDATILKRVVVYGFICLVCFSPSLYSDFGRWFPDTWMCKKCGYENYEGIRTCAVCGTSK